MVPVVETQCIIGGERMPRITKNGQSDLLIKPRANGRNNVAQQLTTLLDVTCCVCLHTLLHVVGSCCVKFETGQTFEPTTPIILLVA